MNDHRSPGRVSGPGRVRLHHLAQGRRAVGGLARHASDPAMKLAHCHRFAGAEDAETAEAGAPCRRLQPCSPPPARSAASGPVQPGYPASPAGSCRDGDRGATAPRPGPGDTRFETARRRRCGYPRNSAARCKRPRSRPTLACSRAEPARPRRRPSPGPGPATPGPRDPRSGAGSLGTTEGTTGPIPLKADTTGSGGKGTNFHWKRGTGGFRRAEAGPAAVSRNLFFVFLPLTCATNFLIPSGRRS